MAAAAERSRSRRSSRKAHPLHFGASGGPTCSRKSPMNYRHAFHAGNFADVMKHALLVRMLAYLQRRKRPSGDRHPCGHRAL